MHRATQHTAVLDTIEAMAFRGPSAVDLTLLNRGSNRVRVCGRPGDQSAAKIPMDIKNLHRNLLLLKLQ